MALSTSGYSAVFEVAEDVFNEIVATGVYDKNLVGDGPNGELFTFDLPPGGETTTIYLLTGKPVTAITGGANGDAFRLQIPIVYLAGFVRTSATGATRRLNLPAR